MSFGNHPSLLYVREVGTNQKVPMGHFQTARHELIGYMGVHIYIQDVTALTGTEKVKIEIYPDILYHTKIFESEEYTLKTSISNLGDTNWLGMIYLAFNLHPVNKYVKYYPKFVTSGYTNNNDARFISIVSDASNPTYQEIGGHVHEYPLSMSILGYEL